MALDLYTKPKEFDSVDYKTIVERGFYQERTFEEGGYLADVKPSTEEVLKLQGELDKVECNFIMGEGPDPDRLSAAKPEHPPVGSFFIGG